MLHIGTVENRQDPLKLGRCQVRIVGLHTHDKIKLPTADLPWAIPVQPITSAAISGIGVSPVGPVEGSWVIIMFNDEGKQMPIMLGTIGGIPQENTQFGRDNDQIAVKIAGQVQTTNGVQSISETATGARLKRAPEYTITQDAIDLYRKYDNVSVEVAEANLEFTIGILQNTVRGVLTQSMFDALVLVEFDIGEAAFQASSILKSINAGKYLDAAAGIANIDNLAKRADQRELFLKDGVPNEAGEITSSATDESRYTEGFRDPNGKYPLYFSEPDTNRLARHEEITKTIVYKKEASLDKNVQGPQGQTWNQSPIPYNAIYPFNHVTQTESGHVVEFDDTPNSERIHIYHRSGTFNEIDANGTQVNRIVGDGYEIIERNGYVHVQGNANVTVEGSKNVLIKNALNIDVEGSTNINVYNDVNLNVSGSLNASVKESFKVKARDIKLEAADIDVRSTGPLNIQAAGATNMLSGGNTFIEAPQVRLAEGARGAELSGLTTPDNRKETNEVNLDQLNVITRGAEAAAQYETPDEGDSTAYQQQIVEDGSVKKEELNTGTEQAAATPTQNAKAPVAASCNLVYNTNSFDSSFRLSTNYTLGALTKLGTRMPIPQFGLSPQDIVCNLKGLCENVLEEYYKLYPNLIITSGFRRPGDVPNSSKTSQHYLGTAVDIVIPTLDRKGHYEAIQKFQQLVPFDQLILEYSGSKTVWIHTSFKYDTPRKQIFTMRDHRRVGNIGQFILVQ